MAINRASALQSFSLNQAEIEQYMGEYENWDKFSDISGPNFGSAIITKRPTGNTCIIPMNQLYYDAEEKTLQETLSGTGKEPSYSNFEMRVSPRRFAVGISEEQYLHLLQKRDFRKDMRTLLLGQAEKNVFMRRIQAFLAPLFFQSINPFFNNDINLASKIFDYPDVVAKMTACGLNAAGAGGDLISVQRIVFGNDFNLNAAGAPVNATVAATIAVGGFDLANHSADLKHFKKLRSLARRGSRLRATKYFEPPIKPIRSENPEFGYMTDVYIALISQGTADYLENTVDWKAQTQRGVIENSTKQPSIFRGGSYLGTVGGIMFIVEPELDLYALNATTHVSVLIGSNALLHSKTDAKITAEVSDHENIFELGQTEIVGVRPIMFNSKSDGTQKGTNPLLVPNGLVMGIAKIA